jgi:hypothetical protein
MDTITIVWGVSLIIGVVVIGVVAILLGLIKNTAAKIDVAAGEIWTQGKLTANNTIQIPLFLFTTNRVVAKIYDSAVNIVGGAKAIQQHAEGCPGCPNCILQHH